MAKIEGVIIKCNSMFMSESSFLQDTRLKSFNFSGINSTKVILSNCLIVQKVRLVKKGYFKNMDLSKGLSYYNVEIYFENTEKAMEASKTGCEFELFKGVKLELITVDFKYI